MSDRLLRLYPTRYITPNVPTSERGTAMLGIAVARQFLRNRKMTITTRPIVSTSVNSTSSTDARTVSVRSPSTSTCTPCGIDAFNAGSSAFTRSATAITFAPGWR